MSAVRLQRVELRDIVTWGEGNVFWAFNHVLAAIPGALLAVPQHLVLGSLRDLSALCPVPYEQALEVLDEQREIAYRDLLALELAERARFPFVQEMAGEGAWFAGELPSLRTRVFLHEHGTRLAVAEEWFRAAEYREPRDA